MTGVQTCALPILHSFPTPRTEEERLRQENARLFEEKKDLIAEIALLKKKMEIEERLRSSKDSALLTFSEILKP